MSKLLAIDFETANEFRASACAIGLAMNYLEPGRWQAGSELLKPHASVGEFNGFNTYIHGIREFDVAHSKSFGEFYVETLADYLSDPDVVLVAHSASFDYSVLRKLCDLYEIEFPSNKWVCTLKTARRVWANEKSKSLGNLVDRGLVFSATEDFGFSHHDAAHDALAALAIADQFSDVSLDEYTPSDRSSRLVVHWKRVDVDRFEVPLEAQSLFHDQTVVFTGGVPGISRSVAQALIEKAGGYTSASVTKKTTILIDSDSTYVSAKELKALNLIEKGRDIQILSSDAFISAFNLGD